MTFTRVRSIDLFGLAVRNLSRRIDDADNIEARNARHEAGAARIQPHHEKIHRTHTLHRIHAHRRRAHVMRGAAAPTAARSGPGRSPWGSCRGASRRACRGAAGSCGGPRSGSCRAALVRRRSHVIANRRDAWRDGTGGRTFSRSLCFLAIRRHRVGALSSCNVLPAFAFRSRLF